MEETSSPSKKLRMSDPDRLSDLPDGILHQILSLLDTKQVVHTSLLSKRWRYLWTSIPNLNFSDLRWLITQQGGGRKFKKAKFRYFIDSILLLRDGSDLQKFSLYFSSSCYKDRNRLDRWITYALRRNVQVLTFGATEFFHTNPIRLAGYVKTLELKGVFIHASSDDELVMNLPVVEDLLLEDCAYCNIRRLFVSAPKLKYFTVDTYDDRLNHSTMIKILTPNLVTLKCKGYMFKDYTLESVSAVVTAEIDTTINDIDKGFPDVPKMDGVGFGSCLNKMLRALISVESLTLSTYGFQSFLELPNMLNPGQISCRNLKHLKLKLIRWCSDAYIHSLAKLLEFFPNLETLVLERNETLSESELDGGDWGEQLSFQCLFHHLKVIEIQNLERCENELKFIAFLLRNATILEKIIITINYRMIEEENEVLEFCEKLLLLPQASSSVTLSFIFNGVT